MTKEYTSLGLMSGTSGDGVDASIIRSDGETKYKVILDKYFKYNQDVYKNIHNLKDKINNSQRDLGIGITRFCTCCNGKFITKKADVRFCEKCLEKWN